MPVPTTSSYQIEGQTVTMPVLVRDASAGTVMFDVDATRAQALLDDDAFEVVQSEPGRAQLNLAIIDYRDNDLGDYYEIGITLFVVPRGVEGAEPGTFITHLPVNQHFTCEAGREIWGFPKTVEEISLDYAETSVTATLSMDGQLVLRLTLPRGGDSEMPQMPMTTYTSIDGAPHATAFSQGGAGSQVLPGDEGVILELGPHPLASHLAELGHPVVGEAVYRPRDLRPGKARFHRQAVELTLRKMSQEHPRKAEIVMLRNRWVQVDPREWKTRRNMTVKIGLGVGTKEQNLVHLQAIWEKQRDIIQNGGGEANPLMATAILRGDTHFVGLKMALTGMGAWFLAAHQGFPLAIRGLHVLAVGYVGLLLIHAAILLS
jgi:hypothetical protein